MCDKLLFKLCSLFTPERVSMRNTGQYVFGTVFFFTVKGLQSVVWTEHLQMKSGIMKSLAINRLTVSLNHLQNMLMNSKAKKNPGQYYL